VAESDDDNDKDWGKTAAKRSRSSAKPRRVSVPLLIMLSLSVCLSVCLTVLVCLLDICPKYWSMQHIRATYIFVLYKFVLLFTVNVTIAYCAV